MNSLLDKKKTELLGLSIPFTKEELTKAYRRKAFETHPDVGGNASKFVSVQDAYEYLLSMCVDADNGQYDISKTAEGISICDLGKGLGDTVNSVNCGCCDGRGWNETKHIVNCNEVICPVCDGGGRIKTIYNYEFWSPLWWKNWRPCRRCLGSGYLKYDVMEKKTYHICTNCKGTGQKQIFNPVLQKGGMNIVRNKRNKNTIKKSYCDCGALMRNGICWRCKEKINSIQDRLCQK